MASLGENEAPLAPPQGSEDPPPQADAAPEPEDPLFDPDRWVEFELRWPSGNKVDRVFREQNVECFVQWLEAGIFDGVARIPVSEDGDTALGGYMLFWGTTPLREGQTFGWYGIPNGAVLTLVRDSVCDP